MSKRKAQHCASFVSVVTTWVLLASSSAAQQGPNLLKESDRKSSQEQFKGYPYFWPILGERVAAKGVELPLPWGVSVQMFSMSQDVSIDRIALGFNDNDPIEIDFIEFGKVESDVQSLTARLDLWVFPFLSVYGLFGGGKATTSVELVSPIALESNVEQSATTRGLGATAAYAFRGIFAAADFNFTWTGLEKVLDPVGGRVFSVRAGFNTDIKQHQFALWGGLMHQSIAAETKGSIPLEEALPGSLLDAVDARLDTACDGLPPVQASPCDTIVDQIRELNIREGVVRYDLDKSAADPWNVVVGGQLMIDRHWFLRTEVGFRGRRSFLFQVQHRFGIPGF